MIVKKDNGCKIGKKENREERYWKVDFKDMVKD